MTLEIGLVYGILTATIALFAVDRLRLDVVALMALLALGLTGILTVDEALAGFSDPVVIMIAGLFVVGDGLFCTGVAEMMGRLPARLAGDSEVKLVAVIMLMVAFLSAFISSTGTVAVMLPVVVGLARDRGIRPSRLLMPLSVASLLGGMLTLIGTPPNIVVSKHLEAMGREPFGFFEFTPVGLVMVVAGVLFMALFGRRLLPDRKPPAEASEATTTIAELAEVYGLEQTLFWARIDPGSALPGQTLVGAALRQRYRVTVVDIRTPPETERPGGGTPSPFDRPSRPVVPTTSFEAGDLLQLSGAPEDVAELIAGERLTLVPEDDPEVVADDVGLVEVLIAPRSRLLGKTLREIGFRERYRTTVLSLRRLGTPVHDDPRDLPLRFGDMLLVKGPWPNIRRLRSEGRDLVVAGIPAELEAAGRPLGRAPAAVAIMLAMMALMTFGVVPATFAVILAAVAMILAGCVHPEAAYRSINWESVVLIAAILPMATALEKTGGMALVVTRLSVLLHGAGPLVILAALFVLTSTLSQVISNTATTVLLAPIAFRLAENVGLNPEPFLMTIAVAASTAFATPIASPVNTLVLGPGGYRFGDFFKVGVILQLLLLLLTVAVVPLIFPFQG